MLIGGSQPHHSTPNAGIYDSVASTQVLIELVPDASKVESALQELTSKGAVSGGDAATFKAGNEELKKRNTLLEAQVPTLQKITTNTSKLAGEVTKMAGKDFAAGWKASGLSMEAYAKSLLTTGKAVESTSGKLNNLKIVATDTSKVISGVLINSTSKYSAVLVSNTAAVNASTQSTASLRQEKKLLQAQIAQLILTGQQESEMFKNLVNRAGEIDDAMKDASDAIARTGSDTRGLDTVLQLASGVTAGFAVAQGAAALFGEENEDVQKALLKVNAAMAILNGLQEIQNLLKSEYIRTLFASNRQQLINNALIATESGLQSRSVVVRGAAAAAQWLLNAAMAAAPLAIVALGIAAIIQAWSAFTAKSGEAQRAQEKLNATFERHQAGVANYISQIGQETDLEIANLRKSGATEEQLRQARFKGLVREREERLRLASEGNKNYLQAEKIARELQAKNKKLTEEQSKVFNEATKNRNDANREYFAAKSKVEVEDVNNQKDRMDEVKDYSLRSQKGVIEARLAKAKAGTEQEVNLKIQLLRKERDIELADVKLSGGERQAIVAKTEKEITELKKQFRYKERNEALAAEVAQGQLMLEATKFLYGQYSDQAIAARTVVLVKQADLDKQSVEQSLDSEKVKAEKISLINQNLQLAIAQQDKDIYLKKLADTNEYLDALSSLEISRASRRAQDVNQTETQRFKASQGVRTLEINDIYDQRARIHQKHLDGQFDSEAQYQAALTANMEAEEAKRFEIEQAYAERRKDIYKAIARAMIEVVGAAVNSVFESERNQRQATLDLALENLNEERDAALDNKNITESQKAALEKRFRQEERRIKREAAKKERDAMVAEAVAKGLLSVISSLAAYPWPFSLIAAAAAAAISGIQIANLKSTPLPGYAKGTKNAPKGMAWVGEEGPELMEFKGGERVYTAKESAKIYEDLSSRIAANLPAQNGDILSNYYVDKSGTMQIDYDKIGKSVAKYMPEPVRIENTMDGDGLHTFVTTGNSKVEHRNKRYRK